MIRRALSWLCALVAVIAFAIVMAFGVVAFAASMQARALKAPSQQKRSPAPRAASHGADIIVLKPKGGAR
jgi:thioesterase domain-containing protein